MNRAVNNIFYNEREWKSLDSYGSVYYPLKALFNFLEHSNYRVVEAFLELIGVERKYRDDVQFSLGDRQRTGGNILKAVIITPTAKINRNENKDKSAAAWIENRFGEILVESRTSREVKEKEKIKFVENYGVAANEIKYLTWEEIYSWLHMQFEAGHLNQESTSFLGKQLLEYFELLGYAPFTGFTDQDFVFFIHQDPHYAPIIVQKVRKLAETLGEKLYNETGFQYVVRDAAELNKINEFFYIAMTSPLVKVKENDLRVAHLLLVMGSEGLGLFANADSRKQVKYFLKNVAEKKKEFIELLHGLKGNYQITAKGNLSDDELICYGNNIAAVDSKNISKDELKLMLKKLEEAEVDKIMIGTLIPRNDKNFTKNKIIERMLEVALDLHTVLLFANEQNKKMKKAIKKMESVHQLQVIANDKFEREKDYQTLDFNSNPQLDEDAISRIDEIILY